MRQQSGALPTAHFLARGVATKSKVKKIAAARNSKNSSTQQVSFILFMLLNSSHKSILF